MKSGSTDRGKQQDGVRQMAGQEAKYQKIINWVRQEIADGSLRSGDKLPSEKELSDRFGLSRQTVRHATGELEAQHIVSRVQGSGTYIGGVRQRVYEPRYMSVAVLSTFYESYIFPPTLKGIERVLSKNGFSMQVSFTDNRVTREREMLRQILEKGNIDGLIVEPAKSALPNPNMDLYREIRERNIPVIFFNASYPQIEAPCVRIDDRTVAENAAKLLLDAGHRKIGAIFKSDDRQGALRYAGYLDAMMSGGGEVHQRHVVWVDTPMTSNLKALEDYLFQRLEGCTEVLCYNDEVAYQVVELALKRGLHVPQELSVVGIDDSYLAGMGKVQLTSFQHPKEMLGRKVAENLMEMFRKPDFNGNYLFESEPVYRESVWDLKNQTIYSGAAEEKPGREDS